MVPEKYVFVFKNSNQADYWLRATRSRFEDEVISCRSAMNPDGGYVSFRDSIYFFVSEYTFKRSWIFDKYVTVYPQEAIYIILNDHERTRLDTYNDSTDCKSTQPEPKGNWFSGLGFYKDSLGG